MYEQKAAFMSRFYDALREANRSRQNSDVDPGDAEWAVLGMNALETPPAPKEQMPDDAAHSTIEHGADGSDVLWNSAAEAVLNSFAPPKSAPVATAAKIAL